MTKKGESFKPTQRLNGVLIATKLFITLSLNEEKEIMINWVLLFHERFSN